MKGFRTIIFNGIVATVGILEAADYSFLSDEIKGPLLIGVAIGGMWLRLLTTTPMGKS